MACPEQYEGVLEDGRTIYMRERHGRFRVGFGNNLTEAVHAHAFISGVDHDMRAMVLELFVLPPDFEWAELS